MEKYWSESGGSAPYIGEPCYWSSKLGHSGDGKGMLRVVIIYLSIPRSCQSGCLVYVYGMNGGWMNCRGIPFVCSMKRINGPMWHPITVLGLKNTWAESSFLSSSPLSLLPSSNCQSLHKPCSMCLRQRNWLDESLPSTGTKRKEM